MNKASTTARFLAQFVVPRQVVGGKSTIEISHLCTATVEAEQLYQSLKLVLLNVSGWNDLLKRPSAKFTLTDAQGLVVNRQARLQDRFRIKIPGPATTMGRGYDWVRVKRLTEIKKGEAEIFYLSACPAPDPQGDSGVTSHFLKRCASTTFLIIKEELLVSCLILSRNEVPNNQTGPWQDRLRNNLVGFFAGAMFFKWQWHKLARTLMDESLKINRAPLRGENVSLLPADQSTAIKGRQNHYTEDRSN